MGRFKRCVRIFQNMKLSKKMILTYMVITGIFFLMSLTALQVSLGIYDSKLYEKSQQELDFFIQQVRNSMEDVERLSYDAALDSRVQDQLDYMNSLEYLSSSYYYEMQKLRGMLMEKIMGCPDIKNVIYTDRSQISMTIGMDCGEIGEQTYRELMEKIRQARGAYVFVPPMEEHPFLMSGRDILKKKDASLDDLGTLLFHTDLAGMIKRNNEALEHRPSVLYVYSDQGIIYGDDRNGDVGELLSIKGMIDGKKGYRIVRHQGQRYFMCYQKSSETGWMYVNFFTYTTIFGQLQMVRGFLVIGFAVIFLLAFLGLRYVSNVITRPLEGLTHSMKIVETGDFKRAAQALPEAERTDEVGELSREFGVMLHQIDVLIHENYEKQLHLQDTRYRMLQAQINPHFLYNTLNSLTWMLKAGRAEDAGKVVIELGNLLRIAFSKEVYTTVEEEIQAVQSYITIQQFRYGKRAEFVVIKSGAPEMYYVPRMMLQPLVENAINYGLDAMLERCRIEVRVEEEERSVCEVSVLRYQITETG